VGVVTKAFEMREARTGAAPATFTPTRPGTARGFGRAKVPAKVKAPLVSSWSSPTNNGRIIGTQAG